VICWKGKFEVSIGIEGSMVLETSRLMLANFGMTIPMTFVLSMQIVTFVNVFPTEH
jgi:hypothetical protein